MVMLSSLASLAKVQSDVRKSAMDCSGVYLHTSVSIQLSQSCIFECNPPVLREAVERQDDAATAKLSDLYHGCLRFRCGVSM